MKKRLFLYLAMMLLGVVAFSAILPDKDPDGFETTQNGLKYKFFVKKDGAKPKLSDFVTIVAYYKATDTIFFDSRKSPTPYVFPVMESTYKGDIFEGLQMLSVGDSIQLQVSGDSLFLKTFRVKELPKYIAKGSKVNIFLKMIKIQSKDDFQAEMKAKFEKEAEVAKQNEAKEAEQMNGYLKSKNITAQPSATGLVYIENQKGTGTQAEVGKTVSVHYTGTLLNGTKFDSSRDRGQPISFELGKGKVIKGWDEGIAKMKVGGKATLVIPSKLGYGERGFGQAIPPFSTLLFEVELVDVK